MPTDREVELGEEQWARGHRAAWLGVLQTAIKELGYETTEVEQAKWILEREQAVQSLRMACDDYGDNEWTERLHLGDVVDKHLVRHLNELHAAGLCAQRIRLVMPEGTPESVIVDAALASLNLMSITEQFCEWPVENVMRAAGALGYGSEYIQGVHRLAHQSRILDEHDRGIMLAINERLTREEINERLTREEEDANG